MNIVLTHMDIGILEFKRRWYNLPPLSHKRPSNSEATICLPNNQSRLYNKPKQLINFCLSNIKNIKPWTIINLRQPQKIINHQIKTIWFKVIPLVTLKQWPMSQVMNSNCMVYHTFIHNLIWRRTMTSHQKHKPKHN